MGQAIPEPEYADALPNSMPERYRTVVSTLASLPDSELTEDNVANKLRGEAMRIDEKKITGRVAILLSILKCQNRLFCATEVFQGASSTMNQDTSKETVRGGSATQGLSGQSTEDEELKEECVAVSADGVAGVVVVAGDQETQQ